MSPVILRDEARHYTIGKVLVAKGDGRFRKVRRLRAGPGTALHLKVTLRPFDDSENRTARLTVRVPRRARGRMTLEIFGGGRGIVRGGDSFDELLAEMQDQPMENELTARLGGGGAREDVTVLDQVVRGSKRILVRVVR
jgi:hypothetical protein